MNQGAQRTIGLIPCKFSVSDINIFNTESSGFCCQGFNNFSSVKIIDDPRCIHFHRVNPLRLFLFRPKVVGDIFMFLNNCL